MRAAIICAIALLSAGGCRHAAHQSACFPPGECPGVVEERCPSAVTANAPVCANPPTACPTASAPSLLQKCCPTAKEKTPEIHVNVPAPQVVVRREEKCAERAPATARGPKPGNEYMLVPTMVYVPYQRVAPTGPAQMMPLNMVPGQPPCTQPPASSPPPCNTATPPPCNNAAPPPCNAGAACPTGGQSALPPIPSPTVSVQAAPNIDDLNRRCNNLENKIDNLIEALNKSRAGGR